MPTMPELPVFPMKAWTGGVRSATSSPLDVGTSPEQTQTMDSKTWYSTEEVAQAIGGVSVRWVRLQVEQGRLRARVLMTGRRATYRIRGDDLAAFIRTFILADARDREA